VTRMSLEVSSIPKIERRRIWGAPVGAGLRGPYEGFFCGIDKARPGRWADIGNKGHISRPQLAFWRTVDAVWGGSLTWGCGGGSRGGIG